MKLSIILPLFDLRTCGLRSLRSSLDQQNAHDFETIVALPRGVEERHGIALSTLLERATVVVRTDLEENDAESEIPLLLAAAARARGKWLFFVEGHTQLRPDAARQIEEHFSNHPASLLAWAPRPDVVLGPISQLVASNNQRYSSRAERDGMFTLGATSVIARELFDRLGRLEARYRRFAEAVLFHRAAAAGIVATRLEAPLADHHCELDLSWLEHLARATGAGKSQAWKDAARAVAVFPPVRHPVYRWLSTPTVARAAAPVLRRAGRVSMHAACAILKRTPRPAKTLFLTGVQMADLSGFCDDRGRPGSIHIPSRPFSLP